MADQPGPNVQTDERIEIDEEELSTERDQLSKPPGSADAISDDEKLWGTLVHVTYFVIAIIGPLLVLFLHKEMVGKESEFIRHHAKQALFWQLAAAGIGIVTCGIGAVVMAVWAVLAALAANKREWYRYPLIGDFAADTEL